MQPPQSHTTGSHSALYAAFDRYPSAKGAALHISHMAHTLERVMGDLLLVTPSAQDLPAYESDGRTELVRLPSAAANFADRVAAFQDGLNDVLSAQAASLKICHFRDPWSGIPILSQGGGRYRTVYEVNGLPSIELPYRYPALSAGTLARIRTMEMRCLAEADAILTPGATLKANLVQLGVPPERITVLPNGSDLIPFLPRPPDAPERYLLYFGALQPWQGIPTLLKAFAQLHDIMPLNLAILSSNTVKVGGALRGLADRLGITPRIVWRHELSRDELAPWIANAEVSVAPLSETARNLDQGCCPLKILEAMAAGSAVVASDLPATRALIEDGIHGRLVRPDRPDALARMLRGLLDGKAERKALAHRARERIEAQYTWASIEAHLASWYQELLASPCSTLPQESLL